MDGVKANASRLRTWTAERLEAALKELDALLEQADGETEQATRRRQTTERRSRRRCRRSCGPPRPAARSCGNCWRKPRRQTSRGGKTGSTWRRTGADSEGRCGQPSDAQQGRRLRPELHAVGGHRRGQWMIVDCDVIAAPREESETLSVVDRIEETFAQKPEKMLADTAHGTGSNLRAWKA